MSWRYLPELVGESSEGSCSDGEQSVQSRKTNTASESSNSESETDIFPNSLSGTMSEPSTDGPGVERWISSLPDSRVNRSRPQEKKKAKTTTGTCGPKRSESFAKWDRNSRSWKMFPALFGMTISAKSSVTWQMQGSMRNGTLSQRPTLVPDTSGNVYGYCATPNKTCVRKNPDSKHHDGITLVDHVTMFPTPSAADHRDRGGPESPAIKRRIEKGKQMTLSMKIGGKLNPTWVEWLMGWPLGWTDLKPLEMDRFQQWLRSHSDYFTNI